MEKSDRKLDKCGVLLWFERWDFDAGFLTTEAAEAGSLGARRPLRCRATRVSVFSVVKKKLSDRGFICWMILDVNGALLFYELKWYNW